MTPSSAFQRLIAFEGEAYLAARSLAAQSAEHLLAEADLESEVDWAELRGLLSSVIVDEGESLGTSTLWNRFPAACSFYLIDAGRREYDHGALYPAIQDEIGLSHQKVMLWGDHFLGFLDGLGLWRFWPDDVTKYRLESILLHCGLPDDAWDQMWRSWLLPYLDVKNAWDDIDDLIELALSDSHAAPTLRTTTKHILINRGEMIVRLITNAVNAGRDVRATGFVDAAKDYGLPPAALASLEKVLDAPRLKWPELMFDPERQAPVCLECPEQRIPATSFRHHVDAVYDVYPSTEEGLRPVHDEAPATQRGTMLVVDSSRMALPPTSGYEAVVKFTGLGRLGEAQERRIRWRSAAGIALVFAKDRFGRYACSPLGARTRPSTEAFYLLPNGYHLDTSGSARVTQVVQLPGDWGGWTASEVSAPEGGSVCLIDSEGNALAEWAIGQTCSVTLEDEDSLSIGSLIAGALPTRVFGNSLPRVKIISVDAMETLDPKEWSCRIEWKSNGKQRALDIPVQAVDRGFALIADPNSVSSSLPDVLADGLLRCEGPPRAGRLVRPFARVPMERPKALAIAGDDILAGLTVDYFVESSVSLPVSRWYGRDDGLSVRPDEGRGGYVVSAPLAKDHVVVRVPGNCADVAVNLNLLGVEVTCDGVDTGIVASRCIPMALLSRMASGFIRVHAHSGSGAEVRLVCKPEDEEESVLRCVGRDGRYTETLGLVELASVIPESTNTRLDVEIHTADLSHVCNLLEMAPGLGLGQLALCREPTGLNVKSEHPALTSMDVVYRDLTAPWRADAICLLEEGKAEARFEPNDFPQLVGKYGLWVSPADPWSDTPVIDFDDEPELAQIIGPDEPHDAEPPCGPYFRDLRALLLAAEGIGRRPAMTAPGRPPALGMLEADADATIEAARSALRAGLPQASTFGADVMYLSHYRYAQSPPVLRALFEQQRAQSDGKGVLERATVLRLPVLEVKRSIAAAFEPSELDRAWLTQPFIGYLVARMHSECGNAAEAQRSAEAWLAQIGLGPSASGSGDVRGQLKLNHNMTRLVANDPLLSGTRSPNDTATTRAFVDWIQQTTTRERIAVSQWIRQRLPEARKALQWFSSRPGPLKILASEARMRDLGEEVKTIANLPFITGCTALACMANALGDPDGQTFSSVMAGASASDQTFTAFTQLLLEGIQHSHELLSQDMILFRIANQQMATGELV